MVRGELAAELWRKHSCQSMPLALPGILAAAGDSESRWPLRLVNFRIGIEVEVSSVKSMASDSNWG